MGRGREWLLVHGTSKLMYPHDADASAADPLDGRWSFENFPGRVVGRRGRSLVNVVLANICTRNADPSTTRRGWEGNYWVTTAFLTLIGPDLNPESVDLSEEYADRLAVNFAAHRS